MRILWFRGNSAARDASIRLPIWGGFWIREKEREENGKRPDKSTTVTGSDWRWRGVIASIAPYFTFSLSLSLTLGRSLLRSPEEEKVQSDGALAADSAEGWVTWMREREKVHVCVSVWGEREEWAGTCAAAAPWTALIQGAHQKDTMVRRIKARTKEWDTWDSFSLLSWD